MREQKDNAITVKPVNWRNSHGQQLNARPWLPGIDITPLRWKICRYVQCFIHPYSPYIDMSALTHCLLLRDSEEASC